MYNAGDGMRDLPGLSFIFNDPEAIIPQDPGRQPRSGKPFRAQNASRPGSSGVIEHTARPSVVRGHTVPLHQIP